MTDTTTTPTAIELALERLVRQAMATGAHYFVDAYRSRALDLNVSMPEAFGDEPASFLAMRGDLTEPILKPTVSAEEREALIDTLLTIRLTNRGIPVEHVVDEDLRAVLAPTADILLAEGWHR